MTKKLKLQRFSYFRFCRTPKIENSEILVSLNLPQILTAVVIQYFTLIRVGFLGFRLWVG